MIGVLHLGIGNIGSLCQCLDRLDQSYRLIEDPEDSDADLYIFPGVGNFDRAVAILDSGWRKTLESILEKDKPFLGICVGYQLLFEGSDEAPGKKGLGYFKGQVKLVPTQKIPHMGWNQLTAREDRFTKFDKSFVYFVHSYAPEISEDTVLTTQDGQQAFCASSWRGTVGGVQFHPEKSHHVGADFIRSFTEQSC